MALDPINANPCELLNATGYPTLFMTPNTTESVAYPRIAANGTLIKYVDSLAGAGVTPTNPILASSEPSSKFRLVQFLSGASIASAASGSGSPGSGPGSGPSMGYSTQTYSTLGAVALKNQSGQYEGIIDTYIAPMVPGYLTPTFTTTSSLLPDDKFWSPGDIVNGAPISAPISVLGRLIKNGYLLSEAQVYTPSQIATGATQPRTGSESLIYLYNLAQKTPLSAAQQNVQATLEATNLKFFGAFMAEYCYYRTRYEWLLIKFFEVYGTSTTTYVVSQTDANNALFGAGRPRPSTSTPTTLTQPDYIAGLTYQMACLNIRLADMRTLLSKINSYYNGVFLNIQANINSTTADGSNKKLAQTIMALQTSASQANKYLTETEFAEQAMKYNSEKNRYSNILLGLYAFLNIAALATVFQLARS